VESHLPRHEVTGSPRPYAAHAARPAARTGVLVTSLLLAGLMLTAVGVVIAALVKSAGSAPSTPTSARLITVTEAIPSIRP